MNMKKIIALLLVLVMILSLAACKKDKGGSVSGDLPAYSRGIDENGFFEGVTAKDYVTLGKYEGISVPADEVAVSGEDVEYEIESMLSDLNTTREVTDRPAQLGDSVDIDYEGYLDGEQFEGGTGNNPSLVLGSGSFIDGFEDGIVGHKTGDNFDLDLTFPESYGNEELAGKAVTFIVTLNSISETVEPVLSDSLVAENFQTDYGWTTVEEMRNGIAENLKEDAIYNYVLTQVDNFIVSEVPESMVEYEAGCMKDYYEQMAAMYGMTLEDLISGFGASSFDELVDQYREELTSSARSSLIYQAIAEDKGLTMTDDEVEAEFAEMTDTSLEDIEAYYGMPYIKFVLLNSKVAKMIRDTAVVE